MDEHEPAIDRQCLALTPFSWLASLQSLSILPIFIPPACPYTALPPFFLFCFWFVSICFISAVPSFLPFQKVMHTRKRHSELYHELNHSSKFHTIDRYSRDPAMSAFKVRSLPRGRMGTHCTRAPPPPILYNT